jgi:CheY-like chemotaxis protein
MMAKRILIVEDDADAAGVVGAYLRRDGFDVAFAEDGKRGVEMHAQWIRSQTMYSAPRAGCQDRSERKAVTVEKNMRGSSSQGR